MSEYESLSEQMEEDFKSVMLALDQTRSSIERWHKTTKRLVAGLRRKTDQRVDSLEERIEAIEKRIPPAA